MLEAQNLSYHINGKPLVQSVSFQIEAGQVFALIGPNGAGKSTLLKLLSGDLIPSSGKVLLEKKDLAIYSARELALKRAVMSQNGVLGFDFTVEEVVMLGRHPHIKRVESDEDRRIVKESLELTEAHSLNDRIYPTLSGGEKARVTLARVLAQTTPVLLLDEPTAALDLRHQQIVMLIARQLAAQGATVLVIVHDLNLAASYADQIGMMKMGQLLVSGRPNDVLTAENIQEAFALPVHVMPHPHLDCPLIVPLAPTRN